MTNPQNGPKIEKKKKTTQISSKKSEYEVNILYLMKNPLPKSIRKQKTL